MTVVAVDDDVQFSCVECPPVTQEFAGSSSVAFNSIEISRLSRRPLFRTVFLQQLEGASIPPFNLE